MSVFTPLMWERLYPFIGSFCGVAVWRWGFDQHFPTDTIALMSASGTVAAVLAGFLSAAKAIVLGLTGSEVFQKLKVAGYHNDFLSYLRVAIYSSLFFLCISMLGFFIEPNQNPNICPIVVEVFKHVWIFFAVLAAASFVRITNNLFSLIRQVV